MAQPSFLVPGGLTASIKPGPRQNSSAGNLTYTLDKASNLTAAEGRTFSINTAGQVSASGGITYTHDGAGNLTTGSGGELSDTYSPTNQLQASSTRNNGTISFTYDTTDQSQRAVITKTNGATTIEQRLENTALGVTGITANGVRADYVRDSAGGLVGQITGAGENLYAITDYQGSTLALINGNQQVVAKYDYKPYGTTGPSGPAAAGNPFRWIGTQQLDDVHGTYLTGFRQYDPFLARFTQPDPSQQELNPYTYGLASPCNNSDPSGLDETACFAGGLQIIGGFLAFAGSGIVFASTGVDGPVGIGGGIALAGGGFGLAGSAVSNTKACFS